ncbi:MAG: PD40 domain-containing protein [Candidatus Eisenbacteria bacterium]|nr:PD40 domain-containing protein [Candidatus Eisenbacteria bacterium]
MTVENVGSPISSPQLEGAPCIAPDGSYLIFESRRPGGYGSSDLYVSFHQAGAWTTPRNLGPSINSTYIEDGPFVSSDGKYLFFNRRRSAFTTEQSEIWWVDARAVFHPEQSDIDALPVPQSSTSALTLWPNPSRGPATLSYTLPDAGPVSLTAYDPLGRELAVLWAGTQPAGSHQLTFTPPPGQQARSVTFYRLVSHGRPLGTVRALALR